MELHLKDAIFVNYKGFLPKVLGSEIAKRRTSNGLSTKNALDSYRKKRVSTCIQILTWGKFLQVLFVGCLAIPGTNGLDADLAHAFYLYINPL